MLDSFCMPEINRPSDAMHDGPGGPFSIPRGLQGDGAALQGSTEAETQRLVRESRAKAEQDRRRQDRARDARARVVEKMRNRVGPTIDRQRSSGRAGVSQAQTSLGARSQPSGPRVYTETLLNEFLMQLGSELMENEQRLKFAEPVKENVALLVKVALPGLFESVRENNIVLAKKFQDAPNGPKIPSEFFFARTKWMVELVYGYLTDILRGRRAIAPGYSKSRIERFSQEVLSGLKMEDEDWK